MNRHCTTFHPPPVKMMMSFHRTSTLLPLSKPPLKWAFLAKVNLMHYFVDHFPVIICIIWVFVWSRQCKLGPVRHLVKKFGSGVICLSYCGVLYGLGCQYPLIAHGQRTALCFSRYDGHSWLQDWWWRLSDQLRLHAVCFLVCFGQVMQPMSYLVWLCLLYVTVCLGLNLSFLTLIALCP